MQIRYYTYGKDGNNVVCHRVDAEPITEYSYIVKHDPDEYGNKKADIYLFWKDYNVGIPMVLGMYINEENSLMQIKEQCMRFETAEIFLEYLRECMNNAKWIGNREIKVAECINVNFANECRKYRENYIQKQEEKRVEQKQQREEQGQKELQIQMGKELLMLSSLTNAILNGEKINNEFSPVTGKAILVILAESMQINIPIKVKGWINSTLAAMQFNNGKCSMVWKYSNGNSSKTIYGYINAICEKVFEKA